MQDGQPLVAQMRDGRTPVVQMLMRVGRLPVGLRSLAPGEADYKSRYFGDLRARDAAYHQGTVWAWLIAIPAFLGGHGGAQWPAVSVEAAVAISLIANIGCFTGFSWMAEQRLIDQIQANSFVAGPAGPAPAPRRAIETTLGDLRGLLTQFLG